ncbi:MAG TPA: 5-formyltetrahydrofolate cyclo-ligase [Polyangia bacterium]
MPPPESRSDAADPNELAEAKRALRKTMRAARDRLPPEERARASQAVCDRLLQIPEVSRARTLAVFASARGEIDVLAAALVRLQAGARVAYPRVTADASPRLKFHVVLHPADLLPGAFGILEPAAAADEVAVDDIDVVLAPGLAFDPTGRRLGYGGGYYDEVAAQVVGGVGGRGGGRGCLVGVGFDFQVLDTIPAGPGDVAVDFIATDMRLIRCH